MAEKIDKWHTTSLKKREDLFFQHDEDYIEAEKSPTNFETSSDEEEDEQMFEEEEENTITESIPSRDKSFVSKTRSESKHYRRKTYISNMRDFKLNLKETNKEEVDRKRRVSNIIYEN